MVKSSNADNKFGPTGFIVGKVLGQGCNYTSIQSAINDAALSTPSTVFIQAGQYTEDITMAAGVSIWGFTGLGLNAPFLDPTLVPGTIIIGSVTASFSGESSISNVALVENTNSPLIVATGAGPLPTILIVKNVLVSGTNFNSILNTSSNAFCFFYESIIQQEGANTFIDMSGTGEMDFNTCSLAS